jgi:hypothetical protein
MSTRGLFVVERCDPSADRPERLARDRERQGGALGGREGTSEPALYASISLRKRPAARRTRVLRRNPCT